MNTHYDFIQRRLCVCPWSSEHSPRIAVHVSRSECDDSPTRPRLPGGRRAVRCVASSRLGCLRDVSRIGPRALARAPSTTSIRGSGAASRGTGQTGQTGPEPGVVGKRMRGRLPWAGRDTTGRQTSQGRRTLLQAQACRAGDVDPALKAALRSIHGRITARSCSAPWAEPLTGRACGEARLQAVSHPGAHPPFAADRGTEASGALMSFISDLRSPEPESCRGLGPAGPSCETARQSLAAQRATGECGAAVRARTGPKQAARRRLGLRTLARVAPSAQYRTPLGRYPRIDVPRTPASGQDTQDKPGQCCMLHLQGTQGAQKQVSNHCRIARSQDRRIAESQRTEFQRLQLRPHRGAEAPPHALQVASLLHCRCRCSCVRKLAPLRGPRACPSPHEQ